MAVDKSKYLKHYAYKEITRRLELAGISEPDQYINTMQKVGPSTLDGIQFIPQNADGSLGAKDLIAKATSAVRNTDSQRVFAGGAVDADNAALVLSMLATKGTGFREIYYLSEPPKARLVGPQSDRKFDTLFAFSDDSVDTSSLHLDLGGTTCNIHIDKAGFVFAGPDGKVYLSADSIQHTADELLIKDKLYKVPVIGDVARFINLSVDLQTLRSSASDSLLSNSYVNRPLSTNRDLVGTLTAEKSIQLGDDARLGVRGSVGYNHYGNGEFSAAATGSFQLRFDENNWVKRK